MIAQAINQAIKQAKLNMGDLLKTGVLRVQTGSSYVGGVKTPTFADQNVDWVPDKFSYQEMQDEDYVQTDVKIIVFNDDAQSVVLHNGDSFVADGETFAIVKFVPTKVGGFTVVYEAVLRK